MMPHGGIEATARMARALCLPVWMMVGCLLFGTAGWAEDGATARLVVATHNILTGNADLVGTAAAIRESGADVVCLQETIPNSEQFLRRALADLYPHARFSVGKIHNGPGFLSKYPIRAYAYVVSTAGINGTGYAVVEVKGRLIQVVNVHLTPGGFGFGGVRGAGKAVRDMEATHALEMEELFKNVNPSSPTLVMGDFNSLSEQTAPTFLRERGFIDSFASVTPYPDVYKTIHFRWRGVELGMRIDFLFHTPHFTTKESRVIRKGGSDHSLVVSALDFAIP